MAHFSNVVLSSLAWGYQACKLPSHLEHGLIAALSDVASAAAVDDSELNSCVAEAFKMLANNKATKSASTNVTSFPWYALEIKGPRSPSMDFRNRVARSAMSQA